MYVYLTGEVLVTLSRKYINATFKKGYFHSCTKQNLLWAAATLPSSVLDLGREGSLGDYRVWSLFWRNPQTRTSSEDGC